MPRLLTARRRWPRWLLGALVFVVTSTALRPWDAWLQRHVMWRLDPRLTSPPRPDSLVGGVYPSTAAAPVTVALRVVGGAIAYAPALWLALAAARRGARGQATYCGNCAAVLRGLTEPACPTCGTRL